MNALTAFWLGESATLLHAAKGEEMQRIALDGVTRHARQAATDCPGVLTLALDPIRHSRPELFALLPADVQAMATP